MLQSIKSRVLCFYHACTTEMQSLISVHRDGDLYQSYFHRTLVAQK